MTELQGQIITLVQALIGVISPNFRLVSISVQKTILIRVILEQESEEDREEIDDLMTEFEALQDTFIDYHFEVLISSDDIQWPDSGTAVVYLRRENRQEYRGGGYLDNLNDAQQVLDAFHSGSTTILGKSRQGFPIVRYEGVTGTNVNFRAGIEGEPTNVFMIRGTESPSIIPLNPDWKKS